MTPKLLHLLRHSQKSATPQPKNFFQVQTRRLADPFKSFNSSLLADPFKPFNSSLAQSAEELWRW